MTHFKRILRKIRRYVEQMKNSQSRDRKTVQDTQELPQEAARMNTDCGYTVQEVGDALNSWLQKTTFADILDPVEFDGGREKRLETIHSKNNWRKMHGIPMRRRWRQKHGKKR